MCHIWKQFTCYLIIGLNHQTLGSEFCISDYLLQLLFLESSISSVLLVFIDKCIVGLLVMHSIRILKCAIVCLAILLS